MARKRNFLRSRHYLRFHLWLRHRCERLTIRQRKEIVYGLSFVYLILLPLDDSAVFPAPKGGEATHPQGKTDGQSDTDGQHFTRVTRQFLPTTSSNNQRKWIINRKNK